jgi:hypothetical protein
VNDGLNHDVEPVGWLANCAVRCNWQIKVQEMVNKIEQSHSRMVVSGGIFADQIN